MRSDMNNASPIVSFCRALRRFLYGGSNELQGSAAFQLLAPWQCGWLDGGCHILADAVQMWLGAAATTLWGVSHGQHLPDHIVVQCGGWYLDGDGVSSKRALLRRWRRVEHVPGATLFPYNAAAGERSGIPRDRETSACLAQLLGRRWAGPAVVALLQRPPLAPWPANCNRPHVRQICRLPVTGGRPC